MHNRIAGLDGLRGLSALLVLLQHVTTVVARHEGAPIIFKTYDALFNHQLFSPGRTGVVTFFLISGFVVPYSLNGDSPLRNFLISRVLRLYPTYWLSLILALIVNIFFLDRTYSPLTVVFNATMLQSLLGFPDVIPSYWTLAVEILFYTLCVALFIAKLIASRRRLIFVIAGLVTLSLISASARHFHWIELPVGIFMFLAIMVLGLLYRNAFETSGKLLTKESLFGTAIIYLYSPIINFIAYYNHTEIDYWVSATTGIYLALGLFFVALKSKILCNSILIKVGLISYSLYLIHDLPLQLSKKFLATQPWSFAAIMLALLTLGLSLIIAFLSYKFIEQPSLRLTSKLKKTFAPPCERIS